MYFIGKRCASIQCIVFSSFYRLLSGLQIWKKLILFFFCIIFLRNGGGFFFSFSCIYIYVSTYKWILMTDKLKTMFYWFSKSQINEGMIRFWYWWESYYLENRQNAGFRWSVLMTWHWYLQLWTLICKKGISPLFKILQENKKIFLCHIAFLWSISTSKYIFSVMVAFRDIIFLP